MLPAGDEPDCRNVGPAQKPVSEKPADRDRGNGEVYEPYLLDRLSFRTVEKPRLSSGLTAFTRLCPRPFCVQLASVQPERFAPEALDLTALADLRR